MAAKKDYIKNIILIMSGGVGSRFGADCPKQYCMMDNRMVIDYVIDECRRTKNADEFVIVAAENYVGFISERYNIPTVAGGSTRPESVANGIKYINEHYDCDKLIITNAVCPLATCHQYDDYFDYLDDYDYVLTTWKLAPALHRFDGERVDRDDFFNVMEPDAYRFKKLYLNFDFINLKKYIFHNMPIKSNAYFCFDYPFTMKLTYPHDLKLLKVLRDELIVKPEKDKTLYTVSRYLSADGSQNIDKWIQTVQMNVKELGQKYSVTSYSLNSQTEANIVYEAFSTVYGDLVFKFTPSQFHFHKEVLYYNLAAKGIMPDLIGVDEDYNALIIRMIKPGVQIKFNANNSELASFFDLISNSMIPIEKLKGDTSVPNVYDEFYDYVEAADRFTFEYDFRKSMEAKAERVWKEYFVDAPKFYLHRDLHRRNLLSSGNGVIAIDPRGAIGPKAFEFVIQFIIELREWPDSLNKRKYNEMFTFFAKYVDEDELRAALFIFWVYKLNDYVFQKNDNFKLATWCKNCILELYFGGIGEACDKDIMPKNLRKFEI